MTGSVEFPVLLGLPPFPNLEGVVFPGGDIDCGGGCPACENGNMCGVSADCQSANCAGGICSEDGSSCEVSSAIDLGSDGNNVTVSNNACLRVDDGYPSWWGVRGMNLQTTTGTGYPIPFTWSNSCTGAGGSGQFNWNWQSQVFGPTDENCATLIELSGGVGSVTLRYWAN